MCRIPGEDELSFAYDGRSKKVSSGKEEEFGESFSEGDIIGCYAVSFTFLFFFSLYSLGSRYRMSFY